MFSRINYRKEELTSAVKKEEDQMRGHQGFKEILTLIAGNDSQKSSNDRSRHITKGTSGRWKKEENEIYLNFLRTHIDQFANQFKRRQNRVFYKLSVLLNGSRTSQQCKSHHQKMQLKAKFLLKNIQKKGKKLSETLENQEGLNGLRIIENNHQQGYTLYSNQQNSLYVHLDIDIEKMVTY